MQIQEHQRSTEHNRKCVVLGEQSLLTQCCELLLSRHYQIFIVVTENPLIIEWCDKNAIQYTSDYNSLAGIVEDKAFDFLFSITNLRILPPELLALPSRYAVNFHDGPLPEYGGLNAPVWSLLNGEAAHGVSWHVMTSEVDRGELLAQEIFPIAPEETAFSLNAKCFQVAIESFTELLDNLDSATITTTSHELSKDSYHGLVDRPGSAATVSWNQSAIEINRLVRSLDFGPFPNPVILPRLYLGSVQLLARSCEVDSAETAGPPGTILSTFDYGLSVATIDGSIKFTRLSDLAGNDVSVLAVLAQCELKTGDRLPELDGIHKKVLTDLVSKLCRHEPYWKSQLLSAQPLEAPYVRARANSAGNWQHKDFDLELEGLSSEYVIAVFALLLARLNTKTDFSLAVRSLSAQRFDPALQTYFSQVVPLSVHFDANVDFKTWLNRISDDLQKLESRTGYLSDMWARDPALADVTDCVDYPVRFDRVDTLSSAELFNTSDQTQLAIMISGDPSAVRIHYNSESIDEESVTRLFDQFTVLA